MQVVSVGDLTVEVIWKDIKNLHLSVHPPTGQIRISAPHSLGLDAIRAFAISRLRWIRTNQRKLVAQPREAVRDYVDRESHYVWGERVLLRLFDHNGPPTVELAHRTLVLSARHNLTRDERRDLIEKWYREELRRVAETVIAHWEQRLGVMVQHLFIQRMKTKWGSCLPESKNIRLNTDLAKKPFECLNYVVLHEISHLVERNHTDAFFSLLDKNMPNWREVKNLLNSLPLAVLADKKG